ncbi:SLC13 family permease, partial [Natronoarchaeum mannanilyticum]
MRWGVVAAGQVQPPPTDALVVFGLVALAFLAFVTEPLPIDVSAILLIVLLAVLEPWTGISSAESISGFASEATITVLAMFVLSEGIRRTGTVQLLSRRIVAFAGGDERKQLASMIGVSGLSSGFINNTPVVAVMIPVATDVANRTRTSPSKLLLPVSFASMFGGMLTLIGTSTNLLASDVSARLLGEPFSMFEFTRLGAVVLVTAAVYLLVVGRHLVPARIPPDEELTEEYGMGPYLTEVAVGAAAPLVDQRVASAA